MTGNSGARPSCRWLATLRRAAGVPACLAVLVVVAGVTGLGAGQAQARALLSPGDPALAGAVVLPLPPITVPAGASSFQFTSNGVTVAFQSLAGDAIIGSGAPGSGVGVVPKFQFGFLGVAVTITPPVAALGFFGQELDGPPQGTFTGALATETVRAPRVPGPLVPVFFGAADIGDISAVLTPSSGDSSAFVLTEIHFVPSGTPPPTALADLAVTKNVVGPPAAAGGARTLYSIEVENLGPDTAPGAQIIDFLPPGTAFAGSNPPATLLGGGVATIPLGDVPVSPPPAAAGVEIDLPAFGQGLFCESVVTNIAVVTAQSGDTRAVDNVAVARQPFDFASRAGEAEVCDNGIDDNCNGLADCRESSCAFTDRCRPTRVSTSLTCNGSPLSALGVVPDLGRLFDGVAGFAHPSDPDPATRATVVPLAATPSTDTVAFTTQAAGDPCDALTWRIRWQDASGTPFTRDVQASADADGDAVADARDNCPAAFNPEQGDADGDGAGDACDRLACDVDGNGQVDRHDVNAIFAARNTAAPPGDPRDASSPLGDGVPDGVITVDDSRYCTLRCTNPRCAP